MKIVLKSESQKFLKPSSSVQPCAGILYVLYFVGYVAAKLLHNQRSTKVSCSK